MKKTKTLEPGTWNTSNLLSPSCCITFMSIHAYVYSGVHILRYTIYKLVNICHDTWPHIYKHLHARMFTFTCIASDSVNTVTITTRGPWIVSRFFTFVRVLTALTFYIIKSIFTNAPVWSFGILALGSASTNFWIFLAFIYILTFIIVIWFISRRTFFFFWNTFVIRICSCDFLRVNYWL